MRSAGTTVNDWETPRLPELASSKDAEAILGVDRMTLWRWQQPDSGSLGPDRTYIIPPKRTAAGPVWVREDLERFEIEVGRQRAPAAKTKQRRRR